MSSYSYEFDSELMEHFVPMVQHGHSHNLAAVYDENQNPLVFTIAKDISCTLAVTVADLTMGKNRTFNLSTAFGISEKLTHIAATQDAAGKIYLAFAVQSTGMTKTNVFVCAPTAPDSWRHPETIKSYLIPPTYTTHLKEIVDLLFVPNVQIYSDPTGYPFLAVQYEDKNEDHEDINEDQIPSMKLERIIYNSTQWFLHGDKVMETSSPKRVIVFDKAVLVLQQKYLLTVTSFQNTFSRYPLLKLYYYSLIDRSSRVVFHEPIPGDTNDSEQQRRLATCRNSGDLGSNDLLVAVNGLYFYGTEALLRLMTGEKVTPTLLKRPDGKNDVFFRDVEDMVTAQSGSNVSVWIRTSSQTICSLMINAGNEPRIIHQTVPIFAGDVRDFSPIFHAPKQAHHFMILTADGQHLVLQFKPSSSVWEEQPFLIAHNNSTSEQPAYTSTVSYHTHILVKDTNGHPLVSSAVMMTASDIVNVTVNGVATSLGVSAVAVQTDFRGCLSVVSPVDSLGSSSVFSLQIGGRIIGAPIDPAININKRLAGVNSGDALRNAKLQNGKNLLTNLKIDKTVIDGVGNDLGQLHTQLNSLNKNGSVQDATSTSIFSAGWAAFHFIANQTEKVAAKFEEEGKTLTMKIKLDVENTIELAVDSVARALKAISYVLSVIKVELGRIVEWIGMIFNWKDIEKTKDDMANIIRSFATQCKTWVPILVPKLDKALDNGVAMVDKMLDQMTINALVLKGSNGGLSEMVKDAASHQTSTPAKVLPGAGLDAMKQSNTSPGAQWSANQFSGGNLIPGLSGINAAASEFIFHQGEIPSRVEGGGFLTIVHSSSLVQHSIRFPGYPKHPEKDTFKGLSPEKLDIMDDLWQKLEGILKEIETDVENLGQQLVAIIKGGLENIGVRIVNLFVTFLKDILNVFKDAIEALLAVAADIFEAVVDTILNASLDLPFIEALWKFKSGGKNLPGLLDICCVLFAIPTNAVGKIAAPSGQPFWPDLTDWGNGKAFGQFDLKNADLEGFFDTLRQWIEGGTHIKESNNSAKSKPNKHHSGPRAQDWNDLSKAQIIAHPVMVFFESIRYFLGSIGSGVPFYGEAILKMIKTVLLIVEVGALAFSFPNLSDYRQDSELPNIGKAFEITGFALRTTEIVLDTVFFILESKDLAPSEDIQTIFRFVLTVFEFGVNLTGTAIRRSVSEANVEKVAAGLAIGNVISSGLDHLCIHLADFKEDKEAAPYLYFTASALALADFGLDIGRGVYEWRSEKSQKIDSGGVHEVIFRNGASGAHEIEAIGDYSGSHQVVTF